MTALSRLSSSHKLLHGALVARLALALLLGLSGRAAGQELPELPTDSAKPDRAWHRGAAPRVRTSALSQPERVDSVRALLAAHPQADTVRVLLLTKLADEVMVADVRAAGPARRAATALARRVGNPDFVDETLLDLADYHIALAEYDSARPLLREAQRIFNRQHDLGGQMRCLGRLGRTWLHLNQPDSALAYAERARQTSQQTHSLEGLRAAYDVLARAQAQRHNWTAAYQNQLIFDTYDDSLTGTDVSRRTAALRFNHEVARHRATLRLVAQGQELDRLRRQRLVGGLLVLALLAGLGGAALLWRYRQRQRQRETALRNSIAADLHDDVGTLLSQIALQSGLLQEGLADAAGQRQQLGEITEASRSAVRQLNDVVWSLDAHNDHLPDLLDRMRDYAYEVLGMAGLEATFEFPTELPDQRLSVLLRRNLYLIYKETLHNVLKHATGATLVAVSLRYVASSLPQLVLEVRDNGQDAPATATSPGRRSGHGLRNMGTRAEAMGGAATAGPAVGGGFRVQVAVPLAPPRRSFGLKKSP